MELELGKRLLDVAKYMLTALILANFFGDMDSPVAIAIAIVLMSALFGGGLWLIHEFGDKEYNKVNKKKGK